MRFLLKSPRQVHLVRCVITIRARLTERSYVRHRRVMIRYEIWLSEADPVVAAPSRTYIKQSLIAVLRDVPPQAFRSDEVVVTAAKAIYRQSEYVRNTIHQQSLRNNSDGRKVCRPRVASTNRVAQW